MATSPLSAQRPPVQAGGIRRSFTQPPRSLSFHERAGLDPSDSAADILYSHPKARIVSFIPPTNAVQSISKPTSIDLDYPVDTIETLPWASSTEEILSSGSLVIEKIRGSTNFLQSGSKPLHALMRNSQCWCVDGEATLVLRVGMFKYTRIELPYSSDEDKAKVQELKDVLKRILRFEATPCPFKRGFHVDLPESATTPRKKGPWKRRPGSLFSSPVSASASPSPLNLKRSRLRATSENGQHQIDRQPSPEDSPSASEEDVAEDGVDDDGSLHKYEEDSEDDSMVDEAGSSTKPGSTLRDLQAPTEPSSNTNFVASQIQNLSCLDERPLSPADQLHEPIDQHIPSRPVSGPDAGNPLSTFPSIAPKHDVSPESGEHTYAFPDEASQFITDSSSSTESAPVVPEKLPSLKEANSNLIGQSIDEDSSTSPDRTEDRASNAKESDSESSAGVPDADEEAGAVSSMNLQTPELEESLEAAHHSPARSDQEALIGEMSDKQDSEVVNENPYSQSISPQLNTDAPDAISLSSCAGSFHSLASSEGRSAVVEDSPTGVSKFASPLTSSYPLTLSPQGHRREASEQTIGADEGIPAESTNATSPGRPSTTTSEDPSTPSLLRSSTSGSSWPEVETPITASPGEGFRRRPQRKRSCSPRSPASALLPSPPNSPRGNHLTGAIVQKAFNLALGKPMEVMLMVVHILFRIAGGATPNDLMNGDLFRQPARRSRGDRRDQRPAYQQSAQRDEVSEEDDFGIPIRGRNTKPVSAVRNDDDADSLFDLD